MTIEAGDKATLLECFVFTDINFAIIFKRVRVLLR